MVNKRLTDSLAEQLLKPLKFTRWGFLTLLFIFLFVFAFMGGFHNVDNCHNMKFLNSELKDYNVTYGENNLFLKDVTADDCYTSGIMLMLISFAFLIFITLRLFSKVYI
jgi:hypothetical protein